MSIDEFIRLFRRRLSRRKTHKEKRRASSVDTLAKGSTRRKKISASTANLDNPFSYSPNSVQIEYRRESDPQLLIPNNSPPMEVHSRPFKRNPSRKTNVQPEISSRLGFAQESNKTSAVWIRNESPNRTMNELPMDEAVWHKRSQKIYEFPLNRSEADFPTTHFPIHIKEASIGHAEAKDRRQLGSPTNESGYGSGRVSGLELSVPSSQDHSQFNSPISSSNSAKRRSILQENTKSMEGLHNLGAYSVPIVLETSFDDHEIVTQRVPRSDLLQQSQKEHSKSEIHIRPTNVNTAVRYLQSRVRETKYVTAVFESAHGGLNEMLEDVLKEFTLWLGEKSSLLGIAVEMHWSVPEKFRSRVAEISLKDGLHRELRNNNTRVLNLYEECRDRLPSNFIESKIEENCSREKKLNAFQGVYRRYYPELLQLQDKKTVKSHSTYWTFENIYEATKSLPVPTPGKFLFHGPPEVLTERSIVALNLATIRLDDSA